MGLVGSGALGAAVYGLWLSAEPVPGSSALLVGGLVASLAAAFLKPSQPPPVRVGALGVMLGEPPEARRVYWYELDRVRIAAEDLELLTADGPVRIPLAAHARAAARILAEAALRVPARVDVAPKAHERLPPLLEAEGELVPAARMQLTGRKCLASGTSITFESDARLCEHCSALYHAASTPRRCLRCERPLDEAGSPAEARSG